MRKFTLTLFITLGILNLLSAQGGYLGVHHSIQTNLCNAALNRQYSLCYQHIGSRHSAFACELNVSSFTKRNLSNGEGQSLAYYHHSRKYISIGFSTQSGIINSGIPNRSVHSFFFDAGTSSLSNETSQDAGGPVYSGAIIGLRYRYSYSHFFTMHWFGSVGFDYGFYKFLNMPDYFYNEYRTYYR